MKPASHPSALRVQAVLGDRFGVLEFDESTKTAADAAAAVGCEVAEIAKSIIFRAATSGRAVLVIASDTNRVDEGKIAALLGEKIGRADSDFVKAATGFTIGGGRHAQCGFCPDLGQSRISHFRHADVAKRA